MNEIKTLEIQNALETHYTDLYLSFGWTLKSSQRVFDRDSHLESRGDVVYSVTNTVDYTKLVFERDTAMPNYDTLKRLEEEYHNIESILPINIPSIVPKTPEQWGKTTSPDVVVDGNGLKAFVAGLVLTVIGFIVVAKIVFPDDPLFSKKIGSLIVEVLSLAFIGSIVGGIAGWITCKFDKAIALRKAIKKPKSAEHELLVKLYDAAKLERESYDKNLAEMQDLREKAKKLLK